MCKGACNGCAMGVQGLQNECAKGRAMRVHRGVQRVQAECAKGVQGVQGECAEVCAMAVQGINGECGKGYAMGV